MLSETFSNKRKQPQSTKPNILSKNPCTNTLFRRSQLHFTNQENKDQISKYEVRQWKLHLDKREPMSMRHVLMKMKCTRYIPKAEAYSWYGNLKTKHCLPHNPKTHTFWNTQTTYRLKHRKPQTHILSGYEI